MTYVETDHHYQDILIDWNLSVVVTPLSCQMEGQTWQREQRPQNLASPRQPFPPHHLSWYQCLFLTVAREIAEEYGFRKYRPLDRRYQETIFGGMEYSCRVEVSCFLYLIVYPKENWISLEVNLCIQEEIHRDLVPEMAAVDQVVCFLEARPVTEDKVLDEE
jgi:hypothetical protein